MATCPECDADVEVDELDTDLGDEVSCPDCGQSLVVSNTDPLELDFADDDEDDDDDDDDDEEEAEDEDDLDEDEDEETDEDWEE
jgi:lysine biosynthesis protein LysW